VSSLLGKKVPTGCGHVDVFQASLYLLVRASSLVGF
jgi:hypothetical protein